MLRNFLYLNTVALDGYMSAIEDGLRTGSESERNSSRDKGLGANAKVASGKMEWSTGDIQRTRGQDTPEARFARLIDAAEKSPEPLGWIDVLDPENDLNQAGYGAMIAGEAEFFTPHMVGLLANGDLGRGLDLIDQLEPFADVFGFDRKGIPDKKQRNAMRSSISAINADLVVVGEFDSSDWKIAGQLSRDYIRDRIEGPARFVGKIARRWPAGEGRHLLALPGTTLLSRHERRALEQKRPDKDDDDSFVNGPAMMLDILAVWR